MEDLLKAAPVENPEDNLMITPLDKGSDPARVVGGRSWRVQRGAERHGQRVTVAVPPERLRDVGEQRPVLAGCQVPEVPHSSLHVFRKQAH